MKTWHARVGHQSRQGMLVFQLTNGQGPKTAAQFVWRHYVRHGSWWPKGVELKCEETKRVYTFRFRMRVSGQIDVISASVAEYRRALRM